MSKHRHTPGPWRVALNKKMPPGNCGIAGIYNDGLCLTVVKWPRDKHDVSPAHRGEANAALIAAAPDMLEALEEVIRAHGIYDLAVSKAPKPIADRLMATGDKIRAAIAKATGKEARP